MTSSGFGSIVWFGVTAGVRRPATIDHAREMAEHTPALSSFRLLQIDRVTRRLREMERRILLRRWVLDQKAEKQFWAWMRVHDQHIGVFREEPSTVRLARHRAKQVLKETATS